jgi:hypothetical protein
LIIKQFENPSAISAVGENRVRHVVACVHVPPLALRHEQMLPIGLQLPVSAFVKGGTNFSSLQGEVKSNESAFNALSREAQEEYGLTGSDIFRKGYLISTRIPVSPDYEKAAKWDHQWLHWFLLQTCRNFRPSPKHVHEFGWFAGPNAVFDAMATAREEKLCALAVAMTAAIARGYLPEEYSLFADLHKDRSENSAAA